jgi:hypothetical protein
MGLSIAGKSVSIETTDGSIVRMDLSLTFGMGVGDPLSRDAAAAELGGELEPGQDLSSGFQERGPTVTITLPFLCPSSTYRWASTISSNR